MLERNSSTRPGAAPTPIHPLLLIATVLACSALLSGQVASHAPAAAPGTEVVARVNGVAITAAQLRDESENLYPTNMAHGGMRPESIAQVQRKALDELIIHELVWQDAVANKTVVPMARVRAEYQRLRAKYGARRFARSLADNGVTVEKYLANLQRRMTLERAFRQKVVAPSRLTPAAVRAYYEANRKKFEKPESLKARLILASIDDPKNAQQEKAAREKIQKVHAELKAGKPFAALAEQYSDDFYKVKGGDLGWVHRGRLEPDFEKVAFALKPGTYSEPFRTAYGYNILLVEAREAARQVPYAQVSKVLKYDLEQKNIQQRRAAWNEELRRNAKVEIVRPELRAGK